ncbi:zinc finger protein 93 isoform X2 [Aedes aegypti]|uniref:Uncharacterized protein n=1 Tax=Aedes aegypti TaxID=7159 RepID=A0A6I8TAQ3_AEDAE|nr:zinc finger protein 93 isoform X2 [Aedes aegypti]
MSSDDLSKNVLCRLCLSDSSVSYPIFAEGSNLADKILECTSIKVEPVEGVPSNICEICKSKLVICSQFVKQCHDIDLQIREKYESFFKIHHDNLEATCDEIEIIDCVPGQDETLTDIELTECLANKSLEEFEIIDCIPYQEEVSIGIEQIKHSDEPKFQCDVCQATLKYRHSLQTHMRSHRNERRHACTYCEMAFVTSSSLKKHIRTHTGDRPYKCTDCPKTFICAGHLHAHKKTHSSTVAKNTENRNKATNRPTLPRCSRKTKKGHKTQNT